jgi:thiopeptide-type bacteriocin biosynthesis protein
MAVLRLACERINPMTAAGLVAGIQVETYVREIDRYGGLAGIELAERFFDVDSTSVVRALSALDPAMASQERWKLAAVGLDQILSSFEMGDRQKLDFCAGMAGSLRESSGLAPGQVSLIGKRFRGVRSDLEGLLNRNAAHRADFPPAGEIRSVAGRMTELAASFTELAVAKELSQPISSIAASLAHMHVNRLIRARQRGSEVMLYEFIVRVYRSRLMRENPPSAQ